MFVREGNYRKGQLHMTHICPTNSYFLKKLLEIKTFSSGMPPICNNGCAMQCPLSVLDVCVASLGHSSRENILLQ